MSKTPKTENAGGSVTPQKIVEMFQTICRSYPKVRSISENRRKAIQARLRVHGIDTIKEVFEKAEASDFLKGRNDKNWSADFDWIMTDGNFSKILDGKYDNKDGGGAFQSGGEQLQTGIIRKEDGRLVQIYKGIEIPGEVI